MRQEEGNATLVSDLEQHTCFKYILGGDQFGLSSDGSGLIYTKGRFFIPFRALVRLTCPFNLGRAIYYHDLLQRKIINKAPFFLSSGWTDLAQTADAILLSTRGGQLWAWHNNAPSLTSAVLLPPARYKMVWCKGDPDTSWCCIIGESSAPPFGRMKVYNTHTQESYAYACFAATIQQISLQGVSTPVLVILQYQENTLSIRHLNEKQLSEPTWVVPPTNIAWPDDWKRCNLKLDRQYSFIILDFLLKTRQRQVTILDAVTGTYIANEVLDDNGYIKKNENGMFTMTSGKEVLRLTVNSRNVVSYICQTLGNAELALSIAERYMQWS
ncbi:hypothetical protein FRB99_004736 [Tulasnella sp. 403]|nr:hypothetical protein FRB99_004736 [Tulasnella sp. 403]